MNSEAFVNRELSWLEFNRRVLEEAEDPTVPLLERVKFLAIVSSNLDEFSMVRVAGLKRRIRENDQTAGPDGLTAAQTRAAVAERAGRLSDEQHRCFLDQLEPLLAAQGIRLVSPGELTPEQEKSLDAYFHRTVMPVVTPPAIDPGHPFPHLGNRSLCLIASLTPSTSSALPQAALSVVHIPTQVGPRFVPLPAPTGEYAFILLKHVIRMYLPRIYQGYTINSCHAIRVTRDADLTTPVGRDEDLLTAIEESLRDRRMGTAVRLQYDVDLPPEILATIVAELELDRADLYEARGFIAFADLFQLYSAVDLPRLKDRPLTPQPVPAFEAAPDLWSAIRGGDILVHHPYHALDAVTRFVHDAAVDPKVLAIKMTLYRVSPASPIAHALRQAAEGGKEWPCSSSCRRASTRRPTSAGRVRSKRWAPTWYTGSSATRPTARRVSWCGRRRTASDAIAIWRPAITTSARPGSTATSGCSRVASPSARISPSCSIS